MKYLAATDALGRPIPSPDSPKGPRDNRYVGIFYFLWQGEHGRHRPYDISKILRDDPEAGHKPDSPVWGGVGTYHHWGEPFYGYYYSDDEWVVRRHMRLLTEAGVDFLFFDTTNALIYEKNAKLVMKVLEEYRLAGLEVPKVMFYTNTASGATVQKLYNAIYAQNYCPALWFRYEGKPVIIANPEECSPEAREFFNIKLSQWPNEADKAGGWPWMDFVRPQRAFHNLHGEPECINVSVAQHPQLRFGDSALYGEEDNRGRSFHNGRNDRSPDALRYGHNLREQFDRALEADVPVTLVTGWNEWIAGRWPGIPERPIMFVDCADWEYSRDIEMMRGGYFDNYYMQLCDYTGRLKGSFPVPVTPAGTQVFYPGFPDGDFPREYPGSGTVYVNKTQRHAVTGVTLSHTEEEIAFVIHTKAPIDAGDCEGTFLTLFLQTTEAPGHNFRIDNALSALDGAYQPVELRKLSPVVSGATLTVTCPLAALGLNHADFTLRFKVCDSREEIISVEDFYDKGDSLPTGRLDFVYHGGR